MTNPAIATTIDGGLPDEFSVRIRKEALYTLRHEPELEPLLHNTVLAPGVDSFDDAIAHSIAFRMMDSKFKYSDHQSTFSIDPNALKQIFVQAFRNRENLEGGHTLSQATRRDVEAAMDRDPACQTLLEVVLFFKGFAALVGHRVARQKWIQRNHSMTALYLQSTCSAVFGMDIHPAATIGAGVLLDHGTGIVIGETAVIGDGCTLLHGVTLGGTGKDSEDRHPKIGCDVLIGAGASILGNIRIGDACKIGAGSVVLRPLPPRSTAVGAPAKIIGRVMEKNPASTMDRTLSKVALLHQGNSIVDSTTEEETSSSSSSEGERDPGIISRAVQSWCPFREYTRMSKRAPPGTITICTLRKHLLPQGCSQDEIGSLFFSLDTRNVGYVHREAFEKNGKKQMALNLEQLPKERIDALWRDLLAHLPLSLQARGKEHGSLHVIES